MRPEKQEWYTYFNQRNFYFKLMIATLVLVWILLGPVALATTTDIYADMLIMNGAWVIICGPYFFYKINSITKQLDQRKEEIVVRLYKKETKDVSKIADVTGISDDYVQFYLEKRGITAKKTIKVKHAITD